MKDKARWSSGIAAIIMGAMTATSAVAWQPDVHWGLTAYLAYHAGFSIEQATAIADANQGLDEDHPFSGSDQPLEEYCPSATCLALFILFGSEEKARAASRLTQRYHFASEQMPPAPVHLRIVRPGATSPAEAARKATSEKALGQALHAYQDSWSHSELPDTYMRFRNDYQWAHPQAKGGYAKTRADRTFLYEDIAYEMAQKTFELLVQSPLNPSKGKPRSSWKAVEASVRQCIQARKRQAKRSCFTLDGKFVTGKQHLLHAVDVEDDFLYRFKENAALQSLSELPSALQAKPSVQRMGDVPDQVVENFSRLLNDMAYASPGSLRKSLEMHAMPAGDPAPPGADAATRNRELLAGIFAENLLLGRDTALESWQEKSMEGEMTFHRAKTLDEIIAGLDDSASFSIMPVAADAAVEASYVGAIRFRHAMNRIVFVPLDADGLRVLAAPIQFAR